MKKGRILQNCQSRKHKVKKRNIFCEGRYYRRAETSTGIFPFRAIIALKNLKKSRRPFSRRGRGDGLAKEGKGPGPCDIRVGSGTEARRRVRRRKEMTAFRKGNRLILRGAFTLSGKGRGWKGGGYCIQSSAGTFTNGERGRENLAAGKGNWLKDPSL